MDLTIPRLLGRQFVVGAALAAGLALGVLLVVALNMMDVARRQGIRIETEALARRCHGGPPVFGQCHQLLAARFTGDFKIHDIGFDVFGIDGKAVDFGDADCSYQAAKARCSCRLWANSMRL